MTGIGNESAVVVLPLPSIHLHPNKQPGTRGGRMRKHRLAAAYRKLAREAVAEVGIESRPWPAVKMRARFYFKQKRRRDDDNLIAWLKPARDGFADVLNPGGDDSEWKAELATWGIDTDCPRVELAIVNMQSTRTINPERQSHG